MESSNKKEIDDDKDSNQIPKDDIIEKDENTQSKNKIKAPKRKFAIIHGYNGHDFCGNQKYIYYITFVIRNKFVRTVEGELETALYKAKLISECNYGNLSKIGWMRASRTDKGVSAVMNVASCKLHKYPELSELDMKEKVTSFLPKDIHIFRFIEVSEHFDSKDNNNNREYLYILPTFMLEPKDSNYEQSQNKSSKFSIEDYVGNLQFKISNELHDKVKEICNAFKGSKKYHNYTKKVAFSEGKSMRIIYKVDANEIITYENSGIQAIKFIIVGQSFLYNQIRKMIGMVIDLCRECKDKEYFNNSFLSNKIEIPKAPAEGLYLRKIDYSNYNDRKLNKKNNIFITEDDENEMDDFAKEISLQIEKSELEEKAFSKWQWQFDNLRESTY